MWCSFGYVLKFIDMSPALALSLRCGRRPGAVSLRRVLGALPYSGGALASRLYHTEPGVNHIVVTC